MINLDDPKKFRTLTGQAHQVAFEHGKGWASAHPLIGTG